MPPLHDGWAKFENPSGPVRVEHADGTLVAYGARAKAQGVDGLTQVVAPTDIELAVFNEVGDLIRIVPGRTVIDFPETDGLVAVVIVDDSVEPEPGSPVKTRGA